MDRRIAKTQKALVEALQQGLTQHPWEDITVQMLCDTADVSRSTFYSHFESKEALLTLGMEWLSQHLQADDKGGRGLDLNGKIAILPIYMIGGLFAVLDQWRINRCKEQIDELLGKLDNLIAQTIKINA